MAWKIRRKSARGRVQTTCDRSIDQMAAFMTGKAEPFCATCGKENDLYNDAGSFIWGCYFCDILEKQPSVRGGEGFGEPDKDSPN